MYTVRDEDCKMKTVNINSADLLRAADVTHGEINNEDNGKHHRGNVLNDLTGREWIKFTKTWFIYDGPTRTSDETLHPAKYPEGMIASFVNFFTKAGNYVFDPFLGTGSTLVACNQTNRNGIGIELQPKYAKIAQKRVLQESLFAKVKQIVIIGDSGETERLWEEHALPPVDFVICSPPYWNMLKKSRGGVVSTQKERENMGLDTHYSDSVGDLGNIDDYDDFITRLNSVMSAALKVLKLNKYAVVIVQNLRTSDGVVKPLAWDIARKISEIPHMHFVGERVWCQDSKQLGIWGYPKTFVPNYHHHYCLIFQKVG